MDIRAAFDEMDKRSCLARLANRGVSATTLAAVARECVGSSVMVSLGGTEAAGAVHQGVGLKQGGAATPKLFNYDMDEMLRLLDARWASVPALKWAEE